MAHVLASKELFPVADQEAAEGLVVNQTFREWLVDPVSRQLLIHGDFEGTQYVSALSFFCSSFTQNLRQMARYSTLVYFCGRHLQAGGHCSGGTGMIRSLLEQLLQQHQFNLSFVEGKVDLSRMESGDLTQLTSLFRFLVLQLRDTVLFCTIDGIKYYEREELEIDMGFVMAFLLDLAEDRDFHVVFKLLVTSPSPTRILRHAFSESDLVSLAGRSRLGVAFNTTRFARQLGDNIPSSQ